MKLRTGAIVRATGIAVWVLLGCAFLLRGVPLLGAGGLSRTASSLFAEPELSARSDRDPVRVFLGVAERARARSPGPEAVLDPVPFRKPPALTPSWPDDEERLAICAEVFALLPGEAEEAVRAFPADAAGPPAENPRRSHVADRLASEIAVALDVKPVTRSLPASFIPGPMLSKAAASVRVEPRPREARLDLPVDLAPPDPPAEWPSPARPLRAPEVFVDVVEVGK